MRPCMMRKWGLLTLRDTEWNRFCTLLKQTSTKHHFDSCTCHRCHHASKSMSIFASEKDEVLQ